uniref:CW-type domain-containing protein n=1 Tax=Guillardia theta TaxID=55529 RepID=A0A7S4PJX1_GUITH|mmetsp:Transcript_52492/g.162918  ORF Transcript_52492/g.162918 Transcript_52492/m.162918 type:complete len:1000 (+) Transcript_52492:285-3284(+)
MSEGKGDEKDNPSSTSPEEGGTVFDLHEIAIEQTSFTDGGPKNSTSNDGNNFEGNMRKDSKRKKSKSSKIGRIRKRRKLETANMILAKDTEISAHRQLWAQCDLCSKWRRLKQDYSLDSNATFVCSDLEGWSCKDPEENADGLLDAEEHDANDSSGVKRNAKRGYAVCPSCKSIVERGKGGREKLTRVLEKHFHASPLCRPIDKTTPRIVAAIVLDLSDRLPYRAVLRKDLKLWDKFTEKCRSCASFSEATRQLLWLYRQLRSEVFDPSWNAERRQKFVSDCETCDDASFSIKLTQQLELEAIDWNAVHKLWAVERPGHEAESVESAAKEVPSDDETLQGQKKRKNSRRKRFVPRKRIRVRSSQKGSSNASVDTPDGSSGNQDDEEYQTENSDNEQFEIFTSEGVGKGEEDDEQDDEDCVDVKESPNHDDSFHKQDEPAESVAGTFTDSDDTHITVGTLVEVLLDDDTKALAIVSGVPEQYDDVPGLYEIVFFDDQYQLALNDRLRLALPNDYVEVLLVCEDHKNLPRGWIPIPLADGTCFVGPQGEVCVSVEEVLKHSSSRDKFPPVGDCTKIIPNADNEMKPSTYEVKDREVLDTPKVVTAENLSDSTSETTLIPTQKPEPPQVHVGVSGSGTLDDNVTSAARSSKESRDDTESSENSSNKSTAATKAPEGTKDDSHEKNQDATGIEKGGVDKSVIQKENHRLNQSHNIHEGESIGLETRQSASKNQSESMSRRSDSNVVESNKHASDRQDSYEGSQRPAKNSSLNRNMKRRSNDERGSDPMFCIAELDDKELSPIKNPARNSNGSQTHSNNSSDKSSRKSEASSKKGRKEKQENSSHESGTVIPWPAVGEEIEIRSDTNGRAWWDAEILAKRTRDNGKVEMLVRFIGFEEMDEWVVQGSADMRPRSKAFSNQEECQLERKVVALTSFGQWFDGTIEAIKRKRSTNKMMFQVRYDEPEACLDNNGKPVHVEWRRMSSLRERAADPPSMSSVKPSRGK